MQRRFVPELMDDPAADVDELDRSLGFLRLVNRRLGGRRVLLGHLSRWSRGWARAGEGVVSLLDVGTGSADLPVEARRWALGRGVELRVTGVDNHASTLELARRHVASAGAPIASGVELVQGDALRLVDRFGPGSFDYVHAGLFLHHLQDIEVLTMLRVMDRLARRGIIWNDLVRSRAYRLLLEPLLIGRPRMVKHDGRVSVEKGFTRREVLDYARRTDLGYARYRAHVWAGRFSLAGEKP